MLLSETLPSQTQKENLEAQIVEFTAEGGFHKYCVKIYSTSVSISMIRC